MKLFIDSCDEKKIEEALSGGYCDGVTTNPSIIELYGIRSFYELREHAKKIARLIYPRPISIEVFTEDFQEMLRQAREISSWGENFVVKITLTDSKGKSQLPVIYTLAQEDIAVNATAMMTSTQAVLAAKAGAKYLSILAGRVDDEGGEACNTLATIAQWLKRWRNSYPQYPELLVASIRTTKNLSDWINTGADVLVVPPAVLNKSILNARGSETVSQFITSAKTLQMPCSH